MDRTLVELDRRLTASRARVNSETKKILTGILKQALVRVHQRYFYRVDFGPDVRPQIHIVSYDLVCACSVEADCPAVTAVKYYLQKQKGDRAETPRPGYFPAVPYRCPVCSAKTYFAPQLTSRSRGVGWKCDSGGSACYWKHQAAAIRAAYELKWKRLGLDSSTFKVIPVFAFKNGYDPERLPVSPCPHCTLARP